MATKSKQPKKASARKPVLSPDEARKQAVYERRQALRKLQGIEPH